LIQLIAVTACVSGTAPRNRIENNDISQIRDITVTNSTHNRFVGNKIQESRRAFNLLFAHRSLIEGNLLNKNSTGIISLNSDGLLIRGNRIMHAMDASGAGIALKETSAALIYGNEIVHCAHGIMADSPMDPINRIVFVNNIIAHNVTGIYFYGAKGGHIAINNTFKSNLWPVTIIGDGDPMERLLVGQQLGQLRGVRSRRRWPGRQAARAVRLGRPHLDGYAERHVFPQHAGARIARFSRTAGTVLQSRPGATRSETHALKLTTDIPPHRLASPSRPPGD
jgi:hypothetical protein